MFHLPNIPIGEVEQFLIALAIIGATGIAVYRFLKHELKRK
jgi:hypothetical protein